MKEDIKKPLKEKFERFWLIENIFKTFKKVGIHYFRLRKNAFYFLDFFLNISDESKSLKFYFERFLRSSFIFNQEKLG